jgi:hypothetical protein
LGGPQNLRREAVLFLAAVEAPQLTCLAWGLYPAAGLALAYREFGRLVRAPNSGGLDRWLAIAGFLLLALAVFASWFALLCTVGRECASGFELACDDSHRRAYIITSAITSLGSAWCTKIGRVRQRRDRAAG